MLSRRPTPAWRSPPPPGSTGWTPHCIVCEESASSPTTRNRDAAETCFRTAIDIARAQEARPYELRAALRLARLMAATGRADEGRALVAPLYEWFTEGRDAPDLRDARAFLADPLAP